LIGLTVLVIGALRSWGFNVHVWDVGNKAVLSRRLVIAIETIFLYSTGFTKISILLFYRRLSKNSLSTGFHWAVKTAIFFVALHIVTFTFTRFLLCRPLNAFWNQVDIKWLETHVEGRDYHCNDELAELLAVTSLSVALDFVACLMPIVLFWKLRLPIQQKIALASLFLVGFM
jgi:hypothetical protein